MTDEGMGFLATEATGTGGCWTLDDVAKDSAGAAGAAGATGSSGCSALPDPRDRVSGGAATSPTTTGVVAALGTAATAGADCDTASLERRGAVVYRVSSSTGVEVAGDKREIWTSGAVADAGGGAGTGSETVPGAVTEGGIVGRTLTGPPSKSVRTGGKRGTL